MAEESFARLTDWFREWRQPLRRFLMRRTASSADIDDIAQEVFLRLLRYDRAELIEQPQAYLFRMALNVSAEWRMRSAQREPHRSDWLAELVDEADPQAKLQQAARSEDLIRALETLRPRQREILRLHYSGGLTYKGIAAKLGITARIVKRDMTRAYADLRACLDPDMAIFGSLAPLSEGIDEEQSSDE